jgi:putative ABC transport system ATP-binding protein
MSFEQSPAAGEQAAGIAEAVVVLEGVSRRYDRGGTVVTALEDASLAIARGELAVVLGPSGSGKSTMLNLIGALDTPSAGRVLLDGRDITAASRAELFGVRRRSVSFIFQTFNLFPQLTAEENVQFGIDVAGRGEAPGHARATLEDVGLGDRLRHLPHELSGGEQQRVAIARALATANPVMLADEPTGELDFRTGLTILELLRRQARERRAAVILVTHNREIARVADRVIELSSGRIVSDAPPAEGPAGIDELHW